MRVTSFWFDSKLVLEKTKKPASYELGVHTVFFLNTLHKNISKWLFLQTDFIPPSSLKQQGSFITLLTSIPETTYSRQKFSGLSWMVKRYYYIQDYSENFRGNTETRTIASDFIRPSIESSLTRREKKAHIRDQIFGVRAGGFLQVVKWNKVRK